MEKNYDWLSRNYRGEQVMPEILSDDEFTKKYGKPEDHPTETLTEHEFEQKYAPKTPEPQAPDKTTGPKPLTAETFTRGIAGIKAAAEPIRRAALTSGLQMTGETGALALQARGKGPKTTASPQTVMAAGGMVGYDAGHIFSNILEGKEWNDKLGEASKTGLVTSTMGATMGGIMGSAAKYFKNPEQAFTKIYGALKEATKNKFDKLKALDFFSPKEKAQMMELAGDKKLGVKLPAFLNDKVTYESLIKEGAQSEGHFEASTLAGERVKPTNMIKALDAAEARIGESTDPSGSAEVNEKILNMKQKIEDSKGMLTPYEVRGMLDDLKDYMSKTKPKEGVPGNSKYQVFTDVDRALDKDIDAGSSKLLSMGRKLYHREKSLDSIFNEGFESGKPISGESGSRAFEAKKFMDAIDDSMIGSALSEGEKKELKVLGTKLKAFELPTSGDFATIRTAQSALSRHLAMSGTLGVAGAAEGGYREGKKGAAVGAVLGAGIGLGLSSMISRTAMTGAIIKSAYTFPEGRAIIDKELASKAGKISAKTTLVLANMLIQKMQRTAQKKKEQLDKLNKQRSQDIVDQAKTDIPEMHVAAPQAPQTPQAPQGQPGQQAPQGMQQLIGQ